MDKRDEQWTIRGLARELGVAWGWVYNRIRNGFLSEPDVSRRPPHGHVLIRDDAEVLTRRRGEVTRSHRLRKNASPPSMPPDPGESLEHAVEEELYGALCHDIENKSHFERVKIRRIRRQS